MKPCGVFLLCLLSLNAAEENSLLLRGVTVHPVSGPDIANGAVLVRDGKIVEVGARVAAPKGIRIVDAKGLHVYPGMIDSATEIGLVEISSVRETNDTTELGLFKPQLRAAAAFHPASEHIPVTRANGITSVISLPAGGIITGQAALVHLDGWTIEEMAIRPSVAMGLEFPAIQARGGFRFREGMTRGPYSESKRQYEQQLRELDEFFEEARRYQKAKAAGGAEFRTDLKFEAMLPLLEGKIPLLVRADREKTIREAIAFASKQKVRMVLEHGAEAVKVAAELKAHNIPVTLGPTFRLPENEDDPYDAVFSAPLALYKAGVKFAFGSFGPTASDHPRNLPYQAAAAVAFGLPYQEALKAVTLNAAEIWGVAGQIGSLEKGKWADLVLTDGDPLEARTQIKQMFIKGKPVDLDNKHYRLYKKYLERP